MANPKIRVGTDFDTKAVEQGLKNIRKLSDEVNKSLNSGEVGIDVRKAKAQLAELERDAQSLAEAMKKAGTADMSEVVSALDEAAASAGLLEQVGVGINTRLNMNDPKVISAIASTKSAYEGAAEAYVPRKVADARVPASAMHGPQMASADIRLDNHVIIMDRFGNELANTITQSQTRVGAPMPAGMANT